MVEKGQRKVGVGIIGYSVGRAHAHAWANISEYDFPLTVQPRLVAIAGRTRSKVEEAKRRLGFEKSYSDWNRLVRDPAVQIIDNCAPPASHHDPMVLGAELGKDLVCEKPLARNAQEAKSMLQAAERAGIRHMTGFNYRFVPAIRLAKTMIEEGELGRIHYLKVGYLNIEDGFDSPDIPLRWLHDPLISGYGALSDLGTHALDLARFLVGEVSSVSGAQETFIDERPVHAGARKKGKVEVDDITVALLKFQNGAIGSFETSWLTSGRRDYLKFEIYGSEGTVRFNLERINELDVITGEEKKSLSGFRNVFVINSDHPYVRRFYPNIGSPVAWEHTFSNELAHFLRCVAEGKDVSPEGATFYDGYRNCLLMDAIVRSARTQRWVSLAR